MRLYRLLLRIFPRAFRARFGGDMADVFADRQRTARARGLVAAFGFWARTAADVLAHGVAERRAARRAAGRIPWSARMVDSLVQDIRYAFRTFRKRPGFTAVALVTLALGIGANTAIFSVVHAVLLRELPYPNADRIVSVYEMYRRNFSRMVANPFNYDTWERRATSFERLAAMRGGSATLTGAGDPMVVRVQSVVPAFFDIMGQPVMGRALTGVDPAESGLIVISTHLWRTRLGQTPDVLGSTITLDGVPMQIIGVMPEAFRFPNGTDIWRPLQLSAATRANMTSWYLGVVGRLKPGVTVEQAQSELDAISADLAAQFPTARQERGAWVIGLHDDLVFRVSDSIVLLQIVVGFVLLVACANVANLLMVSASARRREIGIRAAIGAGRLRLVRQLVTESVLLSAAGALLGVLLAIWGVRMLTSFAPERTLPETADVGVNGVVLLFTLFVSVLTGLVAGIAPAILFSRSDTFGALKDTSATTAGGGGRAQRWLRSGLVSAEVALSLILVAGSALLVQSFLRLNAQDTGFARDRVLTALVDLPRWRYKEPERIRAFWTDLFARLEHAPGVSRAAASTALPFSNWEWQTWFEVAGRDAPPDNGSSIRTITPAYFAALDIPIQMGRAFTAGDTSSSDPVAIVNEAFARQHIDGHPIGQRLRTERPGSGSGSITLVNAARPPEFTPRWLTIVGVAGDTKHTRLNRPPEPEIYRPLAQTAATTMMVVALRTDGDAAALAPLLREAVRAIDRDVPVEQLRTMDAAIGQTTAQRRFEMWLMTMFAALAALLAVVGISGVMAYTVGLRAREVGIRLALGARAGQVKQLMIRQGLVPVTAGLVIGAIGAQYASRLIEAQLFAITRHDPGTHAGVAAAFLAVAIVACWVPARRTSRVDPVHVLRVD
jgi:putative ABC transport system permease protein